MQSNQQPTATVVTDRPKLLTRWIRATTIGWLLGFLLVILLAMAWDLVGGGAQFMVGVGMGAGVGLMQAREVGARVPSKRAWVFASVIGIGTPFLLWDVGTALGLGALFSLPVCALAGAMFAGLLQARLLGGSARPRWVLASVLGWGIPVAVMAIGDAMPRGPGSFLSLPAIFFGGAVLGWVTGRALEGLDR